MPHVLPSYYDLNEVGFYRTVKCKDTNPDYFRSCREAAEKARIAGSESLEAAVFRLGLEYQEAKTKDERRKINRQVMFRIRACCTKKLAFVRKYFRIYNDLRRNLFAKYRDYFIDEKPESFELGY